MEHGTAVADTQIGHSCEAVRPEARDWLLAIVAALVLSDALDAPLAALLGRGATMLPEVPFARLPLLVVCGVAAVLLAGDRRAALASIRSAWPVWPAVALAFASTAWSDQPRKTVLWALALLGTTAFGIALERRFAARAQAVLVAAVVSGIAVASVAVALLFTSNQIGAYGRWNGLYLHKNLLGRVLALGVAAGGVMIASRRHRGAALAALLLCGGVLGATHSVASMLAAIIALGATAVVVAARAYRSHAPAVLAAGAVAIVAVVLSLVGTKPGLRLLARSETYSDRTRIWRFVAATAAERPWLGHGYGAFWTGPGGNKALAAIRLPINHAHNGALDLYAELGIVGLIAVILPVAWSALAAIRHAVRLAPSACLWPATYMAFLIASNVAESGLLRHKLYWALFVAVLCHLVRCSSTAGGGAPAPTVAIAEKDAVRSIAGGA